jgi:hypothetical protein
MNRRLAELNKPWRVPESFLQIDVGESGPFFGTTGGLYDTKRTFNIKVSNISSDKTASNCKVHITKIEPQNEYEGPWLLKEIPSLAAGDHVFIPLATYGEARNPTTYNCADTFFTTHIDSNSPMLDVGKPYVFTLRVTATDSQMSEFRCKLWVNEDGRFRIAKE